MKTAISLAALAILAGCASNSGIVQAGGGNMMITKQAATGFGGLGNLKAEVYGEAAAYCASKKQEFTPVQYFETQGPYILGNYPRVDLSFKCV